MSPLDHPNVCREALSPVLLLERNLHVFPKRVGVIHGDLRWTYARFAEEVGRLAAALARAGVRAGDPVAVLSPNTPIHLAAHFAMPLLQAPLVSINTRLAAAEIAYILEHSGAKVLLVDPQLSPPLDGVLPGVASLEAVVEVPDAGVPGRDGALSYERFASGVSPLPIRSRLDEAPEGEDTVLSINYTSGTTGSAEGRHVHPSRRLSQRPRPDRVRSASRRTRPSCGRCRCSTATAGACRGR